MKIASIGKAVAGGLLGLGLGLLASGCSSGGSGGVMAETVTTLEVQAQVFTPRCALSGCHVGNDAPFGLDLSSATSSAANLIDVPSSEVPSLMRVEPFDANGSYVYMKITDAPGIQGDPMPLIGFPLSASDQTLIETWINQGAR